ncbi:MAG: YkgJ family cysteine cluster protein [Candidatus Woesearchaeota archaeon]
MLISKKTPLNHILSLGAECNNCGICCKNGQGFVLNDEIKKIAEHLGISEDELLNNHLERTVVFNKEIFKTRRKNTSEKNRIPVGACIFYDDENGCTIQEAKPLFCKIVNCKPYSSEIIQWYFLNYVLDTEDPEAIRQWVHFIKYNEPIPGAQLKELVKEEELAKIMNFELLNKTQKNIESLKQSIQNIIKKQ